MTNQELQGYGAYVWQKFCQIFPKLNEFSPPSIEFNNRLSSTAGRCFYENNNIDISWKLYLVDKDHILNQTVPHEYAHQVAWNLYKAAGHCAMWKSVMKAYGLSPDRCHSIGVLELSPTNISQPNYVIGTRVEFKHMDRYKKVTTYLGYIEKINLKTIKVSVNGMLWTVPIDNKSLKKV